MLVYNHEPFLRQAMDSVLMQEISFPYEVVIGEDASTDQSGLILEDYARRYPERIRLLRHSRNQGGVGNLIKVLAACRGKYVAILEGDDYWTDSCKLQRQVDFLEHHVEYALCFHDVHLEDTIGTYPGILTYSGRHSSLTGLTDTDFTIADTAKGGLIPTCSALWRNRPDLQRLPHFFPKTIAGDWLLWLLACGDQKMRYWAKPMATYRIHTRGMSSSWRQTPRALFVNRACLLMAVDGHFNHRLQAILQPAVRHFALHAPIQPAIFLLIIRLLVYDPKDAILVVSSRITRFWNSHIRQVKDFMHHMHTRIRHLYTRIRHIRSRIRHRLNEYKRIRAIRLALRPVLKKLGQNGCYRITLYGAGQHTCRLLPLLPKSFRVCCIVDDSPCVPDIQGIKVIPPAQLADYPCEAIVLSSDTYEAQLFHKALQWTQPTLPVFALYGNYPGA